MSVPASISVAIQSCRPRNLSILRLRPTLLTRNYASKPSSFGADIMNGFPTPPVAQTISPTPGEEQSSSDVPDASLKRTPTPAKQAGLQVQAAAPVKQALQKEKEIPVNVLAVFHKPLKHIPKYGVPTCDLQLRSYSVRNLEFMADFALRAAYYLKLPASGPTPLPKRIERWTMPRSNFVHKKSQENFERITYKRLIQIQDGHRDAVEVWLSFLRRHQFYGVGMKANIWAYESLNVASNMDKQMQQVQEDLDAKLGMFGWNKQVADSKTVKEMMQQQGQRQVGVPLTVIREQSQTAANRQ